MAQAQLRLCMPQPAPARIADYTQGTDISEVESRMHTLREARGEDSRDDSSQTARIEETYQHMLFGIESDILRRGPFTGHLPLVSVLSAKKLEYLANKLVSSVDDALVDLQLLRSLFLTAKPYEVVKECVEVEELLGDHLEKCMLLKVLVRDCQGIHPYFGQTYRGMELLFEVLKEKLGVGIEAALLVQREMVVIVGALEGGNRTKPQWEGVVLALGRMAL